jgi:hypothetical protein
MAAARSGRVDTLLLTETAAVHGAFDPATETVRLDAEPGPGSVDLAEEAAVQTLSQGGMVHMLAAAEMPADAPLAGILRY